MSKTFLLLVRSLFVVRGYVALVLFIYRKNVAISVVKVKAVAEEEEID